MGGLEESATGIVGELSKPVSWGVPADKVCMKLYRKDEQICELKYGKYIITGIFLHTYIKTLTIINMYGKME